MNVARSKKRSMNAPPKRLLPAIVFLVIVVRGVLYSLNGGPSEIEHSLLDPKTVPILMYTWVFGEAKSNTRHLQLFIESARGCGIDIAIVGSPEPNWLSPLPPNVFHIPVTWDELTDRVKFRVFDGVEPGKLRQNPESEYGYYKIIDFKPLFGYLFPEHVERYQFWGSLDNDLILGNLRYFLHPKRLSESDVISAYPKRDNQQMSGAFTLYRNIPKINELFRLAERPLEDIFAVQETQYFDETGRKEEESSMYGILSRHHERLGIRFTGIVGRNAWDGLCLEDNPFGHCSGCELSQLPNGKQVLKKTNSDGNRTYRMEVMFCHYQYTKNILEKYLEPEPLMRELLLKREFRYEVHEGFFHLNGTRFRSHGPILAVPITKKEAKSKKFWANVTNT